MGSWNLPGREEVPVPLSSAVFSVPGFWRLVQLLTVTMVMGPVQVK